MSSLPRRSFLPAATDVYQSGVGTLAQLDEAPSTHTARRDSLYHQSRRGSLSRISQSEHLSGERQQQRCVTLAIGPDRAKSSR